ncbi:MAG: S24/S26 family peptidase [Clostridia bacterium]|nr:S24/S26 family peptidase [Clostridia bacterium]
MQINSNNANVLLLKKIIEKKGSITIQVSGNSMWPYIENGDYVELELRDYHEGDVLLFKYYTEELLVHRLIRIDGDSLLLRGDNAFRIEHITSKEVVGVIVNVIRHPHAYI